MARSPRSNDPLREEIHLPGPSLIPLAAAIGITMTLLGLILSWWIVAVGLAITFITAGIWVRSAREEIRSLPTRRH